MDLEHLLQNLAGHVSSSASVRNVYGEPVVAGNRTVIPVAKIRYALGGGGGNRRDSEQSGGGGVAVRALPCGALEIAPEGTRFIPFEDRLRLGAALALGFVLGAAVAWLTSTGRTDVK